MPDMKLPSYFYGDEAMQFTYFRIPCQLITHPRFKHLSTDFKLLYGMLLDRMSLSIKNEWYDDIPRYQRNALLSAHRTSICRSEGMPYKNPSNRYFTITTGSMGGRPYLRLYRWAVSSCTKDKSNAASNFRRKCSAGTRSSIVTM